LISKSWRDRRRVSSPASPGSGRCSIATARASASGAIGSGKVRAIASSGGRPSAPFAGWLEVGAAMSVARRKLLPSTLMVTVASGGQGSAGRNCSVRASSQVKAPGCDGANCT
jgi:hypothetical protein